MNYRLAANLVALVHFLFVAAAALGGFALLLDSRWIYLHLPILIWSVFVNLSGRSCPLTPLEKRWRQAAGEPAYPGGFVRYYLGGLLPPTLPERTFEKRVGAGLFLWNCFVYGVIIFDLKF